ncbi:MAG: hypothetical protein V1494_03550 [Candidatus Diapherotrites archaeon]
MKIRKASLQNVPSLVKLGVEFMKDHDTAALKRNKKLKPFLAKNNSATKRQGLF